MTNYYDRSKTDDLLNKGGLLNRHENIKGLDTKTIEENSKELIRNNLRDIDLKYTKKVLDEAVANMINLNKSNINSDVKGLTRAVDSS